MAPICGGEGKINESANDSRHSSTLAPELTVFIPFHPAYLNSRATRRGLRPSRATRLATHSQV